MSASFVLIKEWVSWAEPEFLPETVGLRPTKNG